MCSEVGKAIQYRYLMCEDLDGRNGSVLKAWESGDKPRVFQPPDGAYLYFNAQTTSVGLIFTRCCIVSGPEISEVIQDDGTFHVAASQGAASHAR